MHLYLSSAVAICQRLHSFASSWRPLVGAPAASGDASANSPAATRAINSIANNPVFSGANPRNLINPRPVRVVHVREAGHSRSDIGRVVISGRMADVCAELDRLAASEARAH